VPLTVDASTTVARIATFDADYPVGTDVDLWVYRVEGGARILVALSAAGTAEEVVTLTDPAPGSYEVYVDLFSAPAPGALTVEPNSWLVGNTAAGNLTATPASQPVTTGRSAAVRLSWTGLTAGTRYLGTVDFSNGTRRVGRTLVSVNP
jgi:hypothetical protein